MLKAKKKIVKMKAKRPKILKPVKNRKILVAKKEPVKIKKNKIVQKIVKVKPKKVKVVKTKKKIVKAKVKKPVLKKKAHKKVVAVKQEVKEFAGEALFKAKIKVIGIGGGGGSIVSEIGRSLEKATFVVADTDIRALKKRSGIKYLWFGEELTHGLGTGVNVDLAKQAAESAKEKISAYFKDQDIVIFVASLGGGVGSGATQVFAEAAREFGGITFGIFTMPFKFEGKNKLRIAQNALKSLKKCLNVSLVIPNEKIFKVIDSSTPITNAFSTVNKSLIGSLESLIDLIYNPGVINIDFADLRTILKGRGNSAFLNTIEESGKDRVEKTCENIFKNPLLQTTAFKAEKILFDVAGSDGLSMFEVEKISSHIANLNPNAKIIFGISKDSKLKNRIKTTILMTSGQVEEEELKEEVEKPQPEVITEKKEVAKENIKKEAPVKLKKSKIKPKKQKSAKKPVVEEGSKGHPEEKPESILPVFNVPSLSTVSALDQKRIEIMQADEEYSETGKKAIRRSGLEIRKAEELQEKKRIAQEKEWEIPAFLRKVKFKS